MGREVMRVPVGFNWPIGQIWWGYLLESVTCQTCNGTGKVPEYICKWSKEKETRCPTCEGEGTKSPKIEIPEGAGYQMWETVSEGSPISPVFATPEELAHWLADSKASACGDMTATYEQWLATIHDGSAPSMAFVDGKIMSGVEFSAMPDN